MGVAAVSCSGLHCAGCGGGAAVPIAALAALEGLAWIAAHVIEVAAASAACGVLAVYVMVALARRQDRRQAQCGSLLITRADAAPLPSARQCAGLPPTVNIYVADPAVAARVIRQALPAREER